MTNIPKVLTVGKKFLCKGSTNIEKKTKQKKKLRYNFIYPNPETTSKFWLKRP